MNRHPQSTPPAGASQVQDRYASGAAAQAQGGTSFARKPPGASMAWRRSLGTRLAAIAGDRDVMPSARTATCGSGGSPGSFPLRSAAASAPLLTASASKMTVRPASAEPPGRGRPGPGPKARPGRPGALPGVPETMAADDEASARAQAAACRRYHRGTRCHPARPWPSAQTPTVRTDRPDCAHRPF
jgi:hypothetical protein